MVFMVLFKLEFFAVPETGQSSVIWSRSLSASPVLDLVTQSALSSGGQWATDFTRDSRESSLSPQSQTQTRKQDSFTLSKETPKKCWHVPDRAHFCLCAYDRALRPNPEENGRELELNLAFIW